MKWLRRCWSCKRWCLLHDPGPCTRCVAMMVTNAEVVAEAIADELARRFSVERMHTGRLQ
jgi:hypothetical protein